MSTKPLTFLLLFRLTPRHMRRSSCLVFSTPVHIYAWPSGSHCPVDTIGGPSMYSYRHPHDLYTKHKMISYKQKTVK